MGQGKGRQLRELQGGEANPQVANQPTERLRFAKKNHFFKKNLEQGKGKQVRELQGGESNPQVDN